LVKAHPQEPFLNPADRLFYLQTNLHANSTLTLYECRKTLGVQRPVVLKSRFSIAKNYTGRLPRVKASFQAFKTYKNRGR
jgi:hypothetical protein